MGVDCLVWVVPKDRSYRPSAEKVANLANSLRAGRWVPMPDASGQKSNIREISSIKENPSQRLAEIKTPFEREPLTAFLIESRSKNELILDWSVNDIKAANVRFPFAFVPYPKSPSNYFRVTIDLGLDYFYKTGENMMPFEPGALQCQCSRSLEYETGWTPGLSSSRIHHSCPNCGKEFDPSKATCEILDGWTGEPSLLIGGLAFRFALIVDCHKNWPQEEERSRQYHLQPEFLDLWRSNIGVAFDIVTTYD